MRLRRLLLTASLLATAFALSGAVPDARAANIAPNPGFETACGANPCDWSGTRSTTNPHNGSASLQVVANPGGFAQSACVAAAAGTYNASYWYRTNNTSTGVNAGFDFYGTSDCSGSPITRSLNPSSITHLTWTQVSGAVTAPAGTAAVRIRFLVQCGLCTADAQFDDVVLDGPATPPPANLAPNPSFEFACGSPPCHWSGSRDTTNVHSGAASLRVLANPAGFAQSACVAAASGTYDASYWYRTNNTSTGLNGFFDFYSTADCSGSPSDDSLNPSPITHLTWTQVSGTVTAPAGTQALRIRFFAQCGLCTADVSIDDVFLAPQTPTSVTAMAIHASATRRGVIVRWRTATETGVLGFHVWRNGQRLTSRMLPARGAATYRYLDRTGGSCRTSVYRVQAIGVRGQRTWLGAARCG